MASTALVTFMLDDVPLTHSIYLYGSWDNFITGYPMSHDPKRGKGNWRGCHSFRNIICDGRFDQITVPRQGGLKLGGRYYYYYKRDGDIEFHNSKQPFTTACPMLPGQAINILDVPVDLSGSDNSNRSLTMNPEDRYAKLTPPIVLMKPNMTQYEQVRRHNWLTKPFGRLHTAALETCRSGFRKYTNFGTSFSDNYAYCEEKSRTFTGTSSSMERRDSKTTSRTGVVADRPTSRHGFGDHRPRSRDLGLLEKNGAENVSSRLGNARFMWLQEPESSIILRPSTPLDSNSKTTDPTFKTNVVDESVSGFYDPFYAPSTPSTLLPKQLPYSEKTRRPVQHNSNTSWTSFDTISTNLGDGTGSPIFSSASQSYTSPASSHYPSPLRKRIQPGHGLSSNMLDYDNGNLYHQSAPIRFAAKLDYLTPSGLHEQVNQEEVDAPARRKPSSELPFTIALTELDLELDRDMFKDMGYLGAIIH